VTMYVSEYCILREETVRKEEEVTAGMLWLYPLIC
jgi:hypothetical protein